MSRRIILLAVVAVLLVAGGCYKDDTPTVPTRGKPLAKILLTDAPFPYDSVTSVNVYVVRIEASTGTDTSGSGQWVLIDEPKKSFDLLQLQQGTTALIGQGELPAGQYQSIRVTIDTSLSSIVYAHQKARVNWNNYSGSNEQPLYAVVDYPVDVPTEGAEIVIDFDVGRSFLFAFNGTKEFTFVPQIRAINSAATGSIRGTVTTPSIEGDQPVNNANVTVCDGYLTQPPSEACAVATGRSDAAGHYRVAFLRAGRYAVKFEQPDSPWLDPVIVRDVQVTRGETTAVSASLPPAGSSGNAYVRITGPTSVGVGGSITLHAAVGDANGNPVQNPSVTWTSSDAAIATVSGASDTASVTGRQPGPATITAMSGGASGTLTIQVVGSTAPVARVTIVPDSAKLVPGDSAYFRAELRDSAGVVLSDRAVSWLGTDSSVFVIQYQQGGAYPVSIIRARGVGSALLRATSEGKTGLATITVH